MGASKKNRTSARPWRTMREQMLAESDVCHLCGHEGADGIDHLLPYSLGGTDDRENLAPAHHTMPCGVCGLRCNLVKGSGKTKKVAEPMPWSRQWF